MNFKALATVAALVAAPFSASAATMTLWGPNALYWQNQLQITDPTTGITASFSAGLRDSAYSNAPFANETSCGKCIAQHGSGVSVKVKGDNTHELDNREFLRVTFSAPVIIDRVWFNSVDAYDEFDMAVDNVDLPIKGLLGTDFISQLAKDDLAGTSKTEYVADFGKDNPLLKGSVFTFYTDDHNDDYKIAALGFEAANLDNVAPVPLPAGIMLMLGALGLTGATRLRRTRS